MLEFSTPCFYCGAVATETDHCPPRSHRHKLIMAGLTDRYEFVMVDSCKECNTILGAAPIWTLKERKAHIKKRLKQKHKKLMRMPAWSRDDLKELSPGLRQYVASSAITREVLIERIRY